MRMLTKFRSVLWTRMDSSSLFLTLDTRSLNTQATSFIFYPMSILWAWCFQLISQSHSCIQISGPPVAYMPFLISDCSGPNQQSSERLDCCCLYVLTCMPFWPSLCSIHAQGRALRSYVASALQSPCPCSECIYTLFARDQYWKSARNAWLPAFFKSRYGWFFGFMV